MRFRNNVAAIVKNDAGRILVCERRDVPGAWQFPQGGVNDGETLEQALARELYEEIMLHPECYRVVEKRGPYEYLFPTGVRKRGFDGQRQHYFLLELLTDEDVVNVHTDEPEFASVRWVSPAEFDLAWLPAFKRDVYRNVLADFFNVRPR